ncbi:MAG: phosphonate ABC transporter, permease protein PhnE, partial [Pannonibacter indicus]
MTFASAAAPSEAVLDFERAYARHRARGRLTFLIVTAALLIAFIVTAEFSNLLKVSQITLSDGSRAER